MLSCIEGDNTEFTYYCNSKELAPYAISIKIQPPGVTNNSLFEHLTVIAKPYSNPIQALQMLHVIHHQYHLQI